MGPPPIEPIYFLFKMGIFHFQLCDRLPEAKRFHQTWACFTDSPIELSENVWNFGSSTRLWHVLREHDLSFSPSNFNKPNFRSTSRLLCNMCVFLGEDTHFSPEKRVLLCGKGPKRIGNIFFSGYGTSDISPKGVWERKNIWAYAFKHKRGFIK